MNHDSPEETEALLDAEMKRVLELSPEDRRRELEAAGVDIKEVHASADAMYDSIQRAHRQQKRSKAKWASAGAFAALLAAALPAGALLATGAVTVALGPKLVTTADAPPKLPTPDELRADAFAECGKEHWERCLDLFKLAETDDPAGANTDDERAARRRATNALAARKDGGGR